jgi:hypothetical protein
MNREDQIRFVRENRDKFKIFYKAKTGEVLLCSTFEYVFSKGGESEFKLNVFLDDNNEKKISYDRSKPSFKAHANNAQTVIAVFEQWLQTDHAAAIDVVGGRMVAALPFPPQAEVEPPSPLAAADPLPPPAAAVPPPPPAPQAAQPDISGLLGALAQRLQSLETASEQQRQRDQEQQRRRDQAFADAIRDGQENQRRAVAELAARLERTKIKPEVKPEVQQAVAAVQDVVVRVVIPDEPAPVRQVVRRPLIIRREERAQVEEGGRNAGKRRGRDSDDDDTPSIGDRIFNGYKAVKTLLMGKEYTDKWIRKEAKKMNRDNQP